MKTTSYDEITPLEPEWLWPGRIPRAQTTLIAGDGGIGKGFLIADLTARVTRGAAMPDGSAEDATPGSVLLATAEDDPNMAMAYRLRAAGADLSKVYDMTDGFTISAESMPALREKIDELGDVRLVVIDPLSAVASIGLTSSNVRLRKEIMSPMERVARDTGVALVAIHHTVKRGSGVTRIQGNRGITDAARMVLSVSCLETDKRVRVIHIEKTNIASNTVGDVAYKVAGQFPDVHVEYLEVIPDETQQVKPKTTAEKIYEYLCDPETPAAAGAQQISQAIEEPYGNVRVALTRMKDNGVVVNLARGVWTLAPQAPPDLSVVRS